MTKPIQTLHHYQQELISSPTMPVLFLGHGSPMNAIEENIFVQGFRKTAALLPTPQLILCISAHWYTQGTFITGQSFPPTIHDFGGFPEKLYSIEYPAPGDPKMAQTVQSMLTPTSAPLDDHWGFDHGSWSVVKHLYPEANIPMIQMSIDHQLSPYAHWQLAQQLKSLRQKGVLIIGSGNIIHNLRMVDFHKINDIGYGYDWAQEAHTLFHQWITQRDTARLCHYEKENKAIQLSIPTAEHYLPLLYSMGLSEAHEEPQIFNDHLLGGSLSMTSIKWG